MNKDLIDNLVDDLEPVKVLWPPYVRLTLWLVFFFTATMIGMHLRQGYRASLWVTLFTPSMLSASIWTGLFAAIMMGLHAFNSVVPGLRTPKWTRWGGVALLAVSFTLTLLDIVFPSLEVSAMGARKHCNIEVILYGFMGSASCYLFLRKGMFRLSGRVLLALTVSCGMIPALVMQSACMYEPMHNLYHHILPVVGVGLINGLIAYKIAKSSED